ncbi:serine/threonine-protein kinase [Streptomyces sp. BB1-1-1]|uniref:serine/threonine protein kinase n=1 Tax=Streptomyces sp. BB1-1-1 TaxID=3074430 RepID=UPI0028775F29|nr:serine/threonine-protein kinase [Streptomyces sp. BB1-1-1]WND39313.1 serine/threonine-protein kinase [Streptomyces sp. BB1-1-1]
MGRAHVSTHELVAGRYRLLEVVHRETNRVCWSGEDTGTGRPCLVTQVGLPEEQAGETARRAPGRVVRTCETMQSLCPGRVPAVVDAVVADGALWTVTEWVGGVPLAELLDRQGTFNYVRAARIGLELLDVLEAAHDLGVTHGELSPGQVFVREEGSVVVTGFGLAGATLAPRLTAPSYASPEQARDERIGPAADLWTLGAILYTMVEGRPPFRDRGRPETTLKGVDRLPLRTPVRAGPLTQAVQGLLRKNSRERLTRPVVREALVRVLTEDPDAAVREAPRPRLRGACAAARQVSGEWSRRTMLAGTALAVVTVTVAVLAVTHGLPGTDGGTGTGTATGSGTGQRPSPSASPPASPPTGGTAPASPAPPPSATPAPTKPGDAVPAGFRRYDAPEGFSVALPEDWRRLDTSRVSDVAYRVVFGSSGDPRTLAVTYSERAGEDPVAVWRDDVEPGLERSGDYRRIGEIRATTYRGREAADMEWVARDDDTRVRTFGRGFLLGGGRSFSLRWTTPADDWDDSANEQALTAFLGTFREDAD